LKPPRFILLFVDLVFSYLENLDGNWHLDCIPGDMTQVALINFAKGSLSQCSKRRHTWSGVGGEEEKFSIENQLLVYSTWYIAVVVVYRESWGMESNHILCVCV
jgi:hypothetical protein